ncbi:MAG: hypothetical protein K2W96_08350, partial [Gemmataceae bacterium]|nr:hypothetical protein [Gemmataceae bacterium]
MKTLCGTLFAFAVALLAAPEAFTAGPPGKSKKGRGRDKVFTGIITQVTRGKGKDHGSITVRGHDRAMKSGKGKKAGAGKGRSGEERTTTFQVGPKTLFLSGGGKGGARVIHLSQIKEGVRVAIEHHGSQAEEVRLHQQA